MIHLPLYIFFPTLSGFPELMAVIEFVPGGTLLDLLIGSRRLDRNNPGEVTTTLTVNQLINFVHDIVCGMEYIAHLKVWINY